MLSVDDFGSFFREVHGFEPFPWQERLARQVAANGRWPETLDLPTGSGKTAAIDIAVFHLALEASRQQGRRAPVRIAFVVDRRLIVDDAFERATRLACALCEAVAPVTSRVAKELTRLSGGGPALIARRLRGGVPLEDDWARTPSQPTVLCSTVDQVGSRLLFRGYGVSDQMKPIHAGLLGSDCLLLLDEVHLAEPFRQTLRWVGTYNGERWRQSDMHAPWHVASLSATPGSGGAVFGLDADDRTHPVLASRLNASKPARLVDEPSTKTKVVTPSEAGEGEVDTAEKGLAARVEAVAAQVRAALDHFRDAGNGTPVPAICVVLNRVARARRAHTRLKEEFGREAEVILMIGPARSPAREDLVEKLAPIRTRSWTQGEVRTLGQTLIVVATQCVEAGVDLDFDALITEAAPLDALRQRFGRLNRAGRTMVPYAAVVAAKSDLSARTDDPVYGAAIKPTWDYLVGRPDNVVDGVPVADFGIEPFARRTAEIPIPPSAVSEKEDAPVLLPAHLDLLTQTSPIPAADPEVALYLHGAKRQPDAVTVIWRADLSPGEMQDDNTRKILMLVPPRQGEAIELPVWAVRRLLAGGGKPTPDTLADVASCAPDEGEDVGRRDGIGQVFRWKGDTERSIWVVPADVRPGDTVVVPSSYGGCDEFGWNPDSKAPVADLARRVSEPFWGQRFAVRVAPGLVGSSIENEVLADAIAGAVSQNWKDVWATLRDLRLPETLRADLEALGNARRQNKIVAYTHLYGYDRTGRPRGVIFHAPFGIKAAASLTEAGQWSSSEDDAAGSLPGFSLHLSVHNDDVSEKAASFATAAGLPDSRINDLRLAGRFHDGGKADSRFQAWLHYGDPLGPEPEHLLAKSERQLPRQARTASGLPDHWRHEAQSVRRARAEAAVTAADDPELVLWLIGTHHGYGRPLFPHGDPAEAAPDVGPQALAFEWNGADWATLFERLKARYGVWELARMETMLRLADHRASEHRGQQEAAR